MKIQISCDDVDALKKGTLKPVEGDTILVFEDNIPKIEYNKEDLQHPKKIGRYFADSDGDAEEQLKQLDLESDSDVEALNYLSELLEKSTLAAANRETIRDAKRKNLKIELRNTKGMLNFTVN